MPVPSWHRAHTASQHASSSVTERVTKSATYVPKPKVKQERGSRDVLLDASPHQAALDDVLPGGACITVTRHAARRRRAAACRVQPGPRAAVVTQLIARRRRGRRQRRPRGRPCLLRTRRALLRSALPRRRGPDMVPRQTCACPLHMHTLSHTPHPRRAARMCCRAYQLSAF